MVSGQPRAPVALPIDSEDVQAPESGRFGKETLPLPGSNHDSLVVRPLAWSVQRQPGIQEIRCK
jgi:hypothetical protein